MELWWSFCGARKVRLTSAEPVRTLDLLAQQVRMERIDWESELTVSFWIARGDWKIVRQTAQRRGDRVELAAERGFPQLWKTVRAMPLISGFLALLTVFTLWLPSRIFFIRVEGNRSLPAAQILAGAERCGLRFGADRRTLRSEQIKNRLLELEPGLSWAGVNTAGCTATLTVRERQRDDRKPPRAAGDIVACRDGVVTEILPLAGTPVVRVGQAVRKGQVLLSGATDLGICTRISAAEGEVYALTGAAYTAVLPRKRERLAGNGRSVQKFSLILGKKRIKLHSDSGILYPGCGKMNKAIPLRLPGGWRLPVILVKETWFPARWEEAERPREEAEALLTQSIRQQALCGSVAGQILRTRLKLERTGDCYRMTGQVGCREMIGRTTEGVYLEDDARDD